MHRISVLVSLLLGFNAPAAIAQVIGQNIPYSAPAPRIEMRINATGYGQFGCVQRALNRLYAIGATGVSSNNGGVWGTLGSTTAFVWCRGAEAITTAAGPQATAVADQLREVF